MTQTPPETAPDEPLQGDIGEVTVTGLVEGLAGGWLLGWATDPDREGACEIVVVDETDAVVAEGLADRMRSDLAVYGMGANNFGFRLPVPALGRSPWLRVTANGAELAGSPVTTGAGLFDGVIAANDGWVEGWVHERRLPSAAPFIVARDQDGRSLAEGWARSSEGDPLFSPARFRLKLDSAAWDSAELGLTAEADGVRFASTYAQTVLRGSLEQLDATGCRGWLICPSAPSVRFEIDLFCDGVLVDSTIARMPRHDLRAAFLEPWDVGFSFLPRTPRSDGPHSWSLRLHGSQRELFEGPFVIGTAGSHIATARRLARLSLGQPGLDDAERSVLQAALQTYIAACRTEAPGRLAQARRALPSGTTRRLSIVVPVYRDVGVTQTCIDSVLAHRRAETDALVLVNDCSPDEGMADSLDLYADLPNVHVLTNAANCGFVQSVNRALTFCRGDVLLLNSDTRLFAGSIDELWQAAQSDPRIGSVTALSNNATIFSYPIADAACERLADIGWGEVAAVALQVNAGIVLDVPTAHGFCMLIRREMLDRVGLLDEAFGRGYGEENDLCLRAADLGFRHVAAAGVVVEHRESVSFGDEKLNLLKANLARLEERFPEYPADVREFLKRDGLRSARWPVDRFRLQRVASAGGRFVLIVRNWLQGGTQKAIDDIAALAGYGQMIALDLSATIDGSLRLACEAPHLCAVFAAEEYEALWHLLEGLPIAAALIHQLLGFNAGFIGALRRRRGSMRHIYYVHDFYSFCPRVTMIDAIGTFCDVAPVEVCARCVEIGGAHEASRLTDLEPAQHRALFAKLLAEMDEIVVPSANAAGYLDRGLPGLRTTVRPHPEAPEAYQVAGPAGIGCDIVLLGALGPHKGSGKLLEIAQRARLVAPDLRFHVIGYTDIDEALLETGVVSISGPYEQDKLCSLVAATGAAIALFLHRWPETFSYTLSESVQLGLIPLVPDIGAPADRVRAAGYGVVYGFPIEAGEVLRVLVDVIGGRIDPAPGGVGPARFAASAGAALYREGAWLLGMAAAAP